MAENEKTWKTTEADATRTLAGAARGPARSGGQRGQGASGVRAASGVSGPLSLQMRGDGLNWAHGRSFAD
jgi:hypothetical protein